MLQSNKKPVRLPIACLLYTSTDSQNRLPSGAGVFLVAGGGGSLVLGAVSSQQLRFNVLKIIPDLVNSTDLQTVDGIGHTLSLIHIWEVLPCKIRRLQERSRNQRMKSQIYINRR